MVTHIIARVWINRVRLPFLLLVSWTGKLNISLSAFAPENLVSRDGCRSKSRPASACLSFPYSVWIWCLLYEIPPEFRGGVQIFIQNRHHTPSGQSRVYRVTQLPTDSVHCRESAGTGPVNLKVVPNECSALAGHHGPIDMRLSFPHPLLLLVWSGHAACWKYRHK